MSDSFVRSLLLISLLAAIAHPLPAQAPHGALSQGETHVMNEEQQVRRITSKLPRVDVTHADFGAGCPNRADRQGRADSTCAIRNAIQFAEANPVQGGGYPILYFPHGRYLVAGAGYTAALTFTASVGMMGDGAQSTTIFNTSPSAGTVAYNKASECAHKPGPCFIQIEGITFAANGHKSMGGLIEINNTATGLMHDVVLGETGGIALNLQGSSERWIFSQMEIDQSRWGVLTEGDTNENYFERVNVINTGQDESHFCFSVNCPGGKLITSGAWLPDPHSAVYLDGDNVHWNNSSIKSTGMVGGLRLAAVTSSVSHTYFEGNPWGGQPRSNHAIEIGGKLELGHLTQQIGASDLLIPVDDAGWQPLYTNDPALAAQVTEPHAYTNAYLIFPADYLFASKEPSSAVRGITRGSFEAVMVGSFAGDGKAHLIARGQNRTRPIAWPAGSIIEQVPANGYGTAHLESNHLNSTISDAHANFTSGCDDTAQLTQWTSSPSRLCAEVIAGLVPDGYAVPFPSQHYVVQSFSVEAVDNTIYTGGDEQHGQGWLKIAGNGDVTLNQGDGPLTSFTPADTALNTYVNDNTRVQIVKWGSVSALGSVHDLGANVTFSPQNHYYSADIQTGGSLGHQYLGEQCWYALQPGNQQPTSRFCLRAGGPAQETLVGGRWVAGGR